MYNVHQSNQREKGPDKGQEPWAEVAQQAKDHNATYKLPSLLTCCLYVMHCRLCAYAKGTERLTFILRLIRPMTSLAVLHGVHDYSVSPLVAE